VDFRALNSATVPDSHPLPRIEEILVDMGKKRIYSVLDLREAFHQVPLHPESRPLTCTSTPLGTVQWKVLVMGLTNAPQIFQRVMEHCLEPVVDIARPFFDDILVGTDGADGMSWAELVELHDKDLRRLLDVLRDQKLVVEWAKCALFAEEVEFCGHILGGGRRRPGPGKLLAVQKWGVPPTVTALRAFLGLTNYYSSYVRGYAGLAAPLSEKLKGLPRTESKKGSQKRLVWSEEEVGAFEKLKAALVEGLELQHVDPDRPFVLWVGASRYAIGALLEQLKCGCGTPKPGEVAEGKTVPVAFMSRKLTPGQSAKWPVRELEA